MLPRAAFLSFSDEGWEVEEVDEDSQAGTPKNNQIAAAMSLPAPLPLSLPSPLPLSLPSPLPLSLPSPLPLRCPLRCHCAAFPLPLHCLSGATPVDNRRIPSNVRHDAIMMPS